MKLHPLSQRRKAGDDAETHEPEGIEIHVSHEHMQRLGMDGPPKPGAEVEMHGKGRVTSAHTEEVDGEQRHHMRIVLTHAGVAHDGEDDPGELRRELSRNVSR